MIDKEFYLKTKKNRSLVILRDECFIHLDELNSILSLKRSNSNSIRCSISDIYLMIDFTFRQIQLLDRLINEDV